MAITQTQSNAYVEKINSEHPLAVWMLNDKVDYISYLSETQREFENVASWTLTNCTASSETPPLDTPIKDTHVSRIIGSVPSGASMEITAVSVFETDIGFFNTTLANFALSLHLYVDTPYASSIQYGYQYYDPILGFTVEELTTDEINTLDSNQWKFFANTFANPPSNAENIKLVINISVLSGGGAGDYDFLINGLTFGQWSEEFHKTSVGINPINLPSDISVFQNDANCIPAVPYGASSLSAYYISHDDRMYALNFGIPLVYGSANLTNLFPHSHVETSVTVPYPSLIFPGYGFLNEKGKFNEYTAEMWLRINTDATDAVRIFGPIASNDGLYVEGPFLTLVIGDKHKSHYVGEWYRPMLIHIKYIENNASVYLNGEEVISFDFIETDLDFATEFDEEGKSQDWLGFYAYENAKPLSIDSFAIYSYSVPLEVAKRRFVWGQGVIPPETTNSSLNATTAFSDYSFTNYAVNYNYPDFASWRQASFNNLTTSNNFLKVPDYNPPEIYISDGTTVKDWLLEVQTSEAAEAIKYYTFRPNLSWASVQCYLFFKELGVLSDSVESFYMVAESDGIASNETLFKIVNNITKDYLRVSVTATTVTYSLSISGTITTLAANAINPSQEFTAGLNFSTLSLKNIEGINQFFSNQSILSLYVGGDGSNTFTGRMYRVGFDAAYNNKKINTLYDSTGLFNINLETANSLIDHTANYTLVPFEKYGIFFLDVSVAGYWEDYMPLSYFGKYIEDYEGTRTYEVGSIQINLDSPEPVETSSIEVTDSWNYGDLNVAYEDPIQLTYATLDNDFYSGWDDYEDMSQQSVKYYYFDTSDNQIRSFVSFQYVRDGANKNLLDFTNFEEPRVKGVVDPELFVTDWEDTAYEVVDGTVIYPPTVDQNDNVVDANDLALVYHLDFKSESGTYHPVIFRDLQLASQVLESTKLTEQGTRFGVPIYPYTKSSQLYFDYQAKNPITTYKGSTPYLYVDRNSGWRLRGSFSQFVDRGMSVPINTQKGTNTQVSAIQMWIRFADKSFPTGDVPVFSIDFKQGVYDFYVHGDESYQRGYIFAKLRSTGALVEGLEYYINGLPVDVPYITNEQWSVLSVSFTGLLDFDQYTGRININGPLTYNNISYFLATNLELTQRSLIRTWGQTKEQLWDYWENTFTWDQVLTINTTSSYDIDPTAIYERYVGTNRIIVDDEVDGILVNPEEINVYGDIFWSTNTKVPV